jgi:multidrug resistance efflux pump
MLRISENRIPSSIEKEYSAFEKFKNPFIRQSYIKVFRVALAISFIIFFLPWTQTIKSRGDLTTLRPEHRPQTIHSTIAGRIEKWYVREGQQIKKGDTIVYLSEIKSEYFDPELLIRTQEQIVAKQGSKESYGSKVDALNRQIKALELNLINKTEQAKNKIKQSVLKVTSDSIDFEASKINNEVAKNQLGRQEELYKKGLRSLTELETRRLKYQETFAKLISQENKLLVSRNELLNARIELNSIRNDFADKMAKSNSDRFSATSDQFDADATVSKLKNQYSNYKVRSGFYFITAPQDCFITKAITNGIGETVKEGENIVEIMPANIELAVEMYVEPFDLPLVQLDEKVRIEFDGWPTIIFSGWPDLSFGTFGGKIVGVDNNISSNGKFRILVGEDKTDRPWPKQLKIGSGCNGLALLNDVPIWWETWRQINSFPANYYVPKEMNAKKSAKEKPNKEKSK